MGKYKNGNFMTVPMINEKNQEDEMGELTYLMPERVREIAEEVGTLCDQMEYDGSFMYETYPDRRIVEKKVNEICISLQKSDCAELVQVILCKEMEYRRQRRKCHKRECHKRNYFSSKSI